jgi:hypothetical protein
MTDLPVVPTDVPTDIPTDMKNQAWMREMLVLVAGQMPTWDVIRHHVFWTVSNMNDCITGHVDSWDAGYEPTDGELWAKMVAEEGLEFCLEWHGKYQVKEGDPTADEKPHGDIRAIISPSTLEMGKKKYPVFTPPRRKPSCRKVVREKDPPRRLPADAKMLAQLSALRAEWNKGHYAICDNSRYRSALFGFVLIIALGTTPEAFNAAGVHVWDEFIAEADADSVEKSMSMDQLVRYATSRINAMVARHAKKVSAGCV